MAGIRAIRFAEASMCLITKPIWVIRFEPNTPDTDAYSRFWKL